MVYGASTGAASSQTTTPTNTASPLTCAILEPGSWLCEWCPGRRWSHENFTPGTMERWGLGYEQLKETNPGVVMFSTSMMGRGGPTERQPGFGHVLTSLAGLTHITGWPDREPVNPFGPYTDFIGPQIRCPVHPCRVRLS